MAAAAAAVAAAAGSIAHAEDLQGFRVVVSGSGASGNSGVEWEKPWVRV